MNFNMDFEFLSYEQFELLCVRLLQEEGYTLKSRPGRSRDVGVDFIVSTPEHRELIVEVKHRRYPIMRTSDIRAAVVELSNACRLLNADKALLIASGTVSQRTIAEAKILGAVIIWDRAVLKHLLQKYPHVAKEFFLLLDAQNHNEKQLDRHEIQDARALELRHRLEMLPAAKIIGGHLKISVLRS